MIENKDGPPAEPKASGYSWYVLSVLVIVYILNFIDRQIVAILAVDILPAFLKDGRCLHDRIADTRVDDLKPSYYWI